MWGEKFRHGVSHLYNNFQPEIFISNIQINFKYCIKLCGSYWELVWKDFNACSVFFCPNPCLCFYFYADGRGTCQPAQNALEAKVGATIYELSSNMGPILLTMPNFFSIGSTLVFNKYNLINYYKNLILTYW